MRTPAPGTSTASRRPAAEPPCIPDASTRMRTIPVIGLPIAAIQYAGAVAWVIEHARAGDRAYAVEAANTHVAALARTDAGFGDVMARFDLICPDGMPLLWVINSRLAPEEKLTDRVYGPTLMLEMFKASSGVGDLRHFLLGGKAATLTKLTEIFASRFPGAAVVGTHAPPFGEWPADEVERICREISESGANLIWVGLGCPKQEQWIAAHKDRLPPGVYFGIGAAFAFHAGEVRQAPPVFQRMGLEWFYRLCMEPRRLLRRYVTYNSIFLYHLLRDRLLGHG